MLLPGVASWARLSDDGHYRYELGRQWTSGDPEIVWVMLNPSTADAATDDRTIRNVIRISQAHGFGAAIVVNLFALRSTNPSVLRAHPDPVGPDNPRTIRDAIRPHRAVAVAWGASNPHPDTPTIRLVSACASDVRARLWCLGVNRDGSPRHPCRMSPSAPLVPYAGR